MLDHILHTVMSAVLSAALCMHAAITWLLHFTNSIIMIVCNSGPGNATYLLTQDDWPLLIAACEKNDVMLDIWIVPYKTISCLIVSHSDIGTDVQYCGEGRYMNNILL